MEERKKYVPLGSRIFRVIQRIYIGLLILCLAVGSLSLAVNAVSAKIGAGVRFLTVRTDSMLPEFIEGDLAIVCSKSAEKISEGDVIAYRPGEEEDAYLIHRVTEKFSDYEGTGVTCFYTEGDFTEEEDGILVDESHVIGTLVVTIPKLGYILRFFVMHWYCPVLVALAALLVFLAIRLARYWMDHREDDFPDGEDPEAGGFWLKNSSGRGIRIAKWQVAHVFSLLLVLVAVAGIAVLWKVSEDEVVATLMQAENGGVVAVEDYASVSQSDGTAGDEAIGGETLPGEKTADESGCFASEYLAVIADELEGIRVMNTGNLESLVRAVLAGEGWSFDYEHIVTRAAGDAETESYITAVWCGKDAVWYGNDAEETEKSATDDDENALEEASADENEEALEEASADDSENTVSESAETGNGDRLVLRIYLSSVVLSTDKENQDIESRYPSEEDYDMENEEGQEAYEEANYAAFMTLKYNWTFDEGGSDAETAYFYYNYTLQPVTGTKELIERVEVVEDDIGEADEMTGIGNVGETAETGEADETAETGNAGETTAAENAAEAIQTETQIASIRCRMENIVIEENEELISKDSYLDALSGSGWSMVIKNAEAGSTGHQISSKLYFLETVMLEWQTPEEREEELEDERGYGSMD